MRSSSRTDEDLLSAADARSFEEFYLRHVDMVSATSPAARATPSWRPT